MNALTGKKSIGVLLAAIVLLAGASTARAQSFGSYDFNNQSGLNAAADRAGYDVTSGSTSIDSLIGQVIYLGLSFVGIAFFGFLLYGGIMWMTARSNEDKVNQATEIIIACIIGLIITLAAYAITYFLVSYFAPPSSSTAVPETPAPATVIDLI